VLKALSLLPFRLAPPGAFTRRRGRIIKEVGAAAAEIDARL